MIHAVVHEGAAPLGDDEADVTQHLEVVGDRRLAEREVIGDVADADWLLAHGQQVENADAGGIGQGLEPGGVRLGLRFRDRGCAGRRAAGLIKHGDGRSFERRGHEKTPSYGQSIDCTLMFVNRYIDHSRCILVVASRAVRSACRAAGAIRMAAKSGPGRRRRVVWGKVGADSREEFHVAGVFVVTLVVEGSLAERRGYRDGDLPGREVGHYPAAAGEERVLQDPGIGADHTETIVQRLFEGAAGGATLQRCAEPDQIGGDLRLVGRRRQQRPLADSDGAGGHVGDIGRLDRSLGERPGRVPIGRLLIEARAGGDPKSLPSLRAEGVQDRLRDLRRRPGDRVA